MRPLERFEMERMQSLWWHRVDHDLSESGVRPMTIRELLGPDADAEAFLAGALGYPVSEGSEETRAHIASWYPGATADHVTITNGGSEANFLTLWTLLGPGRRLACMLPNYLQGWGLGPHFGEASDPFFLRLREGRWSLDLDSLEAAVGPDTAAILVCNPNNPTGAVLDDGEIDAVIAAADRVGAWIVADEIYRGAEVDTDETSPTFWGRTDRVIVTSGLSKAFGLPGLRVGWAVAPTEMIARLWERHDYTTLTPNIVSDRLAAVALEPRRREEILGRTRGIIRANLPPLEEWINAHDAFTYARPIAGAIAYVVYDLPIGSTELVDRIREERSVLVVPGDQFGLSKGLRFGTGYDIGDTLKGLALADEVLATHGG